jgi:hypothetical protein
MPKCLECGFVAPRLQWTHFKFNCTGRFNSGKEYKKFYTSAKLVDDDLAKNTAVTLENLQKKHGKKEGQLRWEEYRKKQSYTNSFKYKKEKYGWNEDQFKSYNQSRAITIENMILRYGEEDGIEKWEEYCEKQRYTKTKDYLIKKHGQEEGTKKYKEICLKKSEPHDPKLLSKKLGITVDEAIEIICKRGTYKFTSILEKEFIDSIEKIIGPLENTSMKNPFGKWCHELGKYVVYDIKHKDCIIEFNGDYWHANPNIYEKNDFIRNLSAKDIWQRDKIKIKTANKSGFRTKVIWENDFLKDKEKIIKEVCEWILKEQN